MTGVSVAALSVVIASGVNAEAATFTTDKHMAGITSGDMVSYDAVKDKKGTPTWNAKAKWDTYYGTVSYVDITNVKTTKDAYITVKSSSGYTVYKIEKDKVSKYKGKIEGSTLKITEGTTEVNKSHSSWANYEYRTESGSWEGLTTNTEISLAPYEQQGATLYFRHKGASSAISAAQDSATKISGAPEGVTINKIAANSFAGKEFKVKVPKMGNAPAITVDYNTGAIKAKKGAEYRTGTSFTDATSNWKDFDANQTLDVSAAGIFQMRTKATEKKAASKIAVYNWAKVEAPNVTANSAAAASGTFIANELVYTSAEAEKVEKATFEIENKTDKTYVLYKTKTENGKTVADGKAVATIKAKKKVTLKASKVTNNTELAVQIAGDKKADQLPSPLSSSKIKIIYNVKAES